MSRMVWMFSGQGAQYFNMGRDLFEADPDFRAAMQGCDVHCRRIAGFPLLDVLYPADGGSMLDPFDYLPHTHPALLSIQYSLAQTLLRRGYKPDLLLGYSLGEWVAMVVAGALPFSVALECLFRQADTSLRNSPEGGMLAVMATPDRLAGFSRVDELTVAARNFPGHFVLSGLREPIEAAQDFLRSEGITHQRLPVHFAFHSPWMEPLREPVQKLLRDLPLQPPAIPILSLAKAEILHAVDGEHFWHVVRNPVRFQECVERFGPWEGDQCVDLGPSGTLATFLKYSLPQGSSCRIYPILTPFHQAESNLARLESDL